MRLDFTKPWLRGMKMIPRKGDQPPRLEPIVKVVPLKDDDGKTIVPKVVHGVPGRAERWKPEDAKDTRTAEKGKK